MVNEITLFELHLDDARFGTSGPDADDNSASEAEAESDGPGTGKLLLASLLVSIAVTVLVRRLVGEDADDADESEDPIAVDIET